MTLKLSRTSLVTDLPKGYQAAVVACPSLASLKLYLFYPAKRRFINYIARDGMDYFCYHCDQKESCPAAFSSNLISAGGCQKDMTLSQMQKGQIWANTHASLWQFNLSYGNIHLYAWKEEEGSLKVCPYLYANVYDDGRVCWGSSAPKTIPQAVSTYWAAPFNNDLSRSETMPSSGFLGHLENWAPREESWVQSGILERPHVITTRQTEGLVISCSSSALNKIPEGYYHCPKSNPFITAWTRRNESGIFMAVTHPSQKYDLIVHKKSPTTKSVSVIGTSKDFSNVIYED